MRGGRFFKAMRTLSRQPVISTPLIRNAFELGHCVSKPIKQGCLSPPSKQKEYFLIGLSASMKQCSLKPNFHMKAIPHMKASSSAVMIEPKEEQETALEKAAEEQPPREEIIQVSSSYWGITSSKLEDGTAKSWNSFRPAQTCIADATVDLTRHRTPENFSDQFARLTVMALRLPGDLFFRTRYFCRAAMLETIAGVPGMVGGILLHCKSLRRIEHSGGWIKALMEEAENERMHLMTFMELSKPSWQERALVFAVQALFFNVYLLLYVISPRFAHRMVGYLGEETIQSYTDLIKDIDDGKIRNVPAPEVAIDYWRLPQDATLRDVVMVIRADEAHHRDMNHFAADVHLQGQQLKAAPVPFGSH